MSLARPLCIKLFLSLEEQRINLLYVLIKICVFEPGYSDFEVSIDNRYFVTFVYTKVERLNVVMMREYAIDFRLCEYIRYESSQMICRDLLIFVKQVRLCQDFDGFLELLQFAHRSLLF